MRDSLLSTKRNGRKHKMRANCFFFCRREGEEDKKDRGTTRDEGRASNANAGFLFSFDDVDVVVWDTKAMN